MLGNIALANTNFYSYMKFTVQQIANLLGGQVEGEKDAEISELAKIDEQAPPNSICFLANLKYEPFIYETNATAVIVSQDFTPRKTLKTNLIRVKDAYLAFSTLMTEYSRLLSLAQQNTRQGIEQPSSLDASSHYGDNFYLGAFAYVGRNCQIGDNVKIYPQAYIGDNVQIGDNTVIYPGVKIYDGCKIGKNCLLHAGAVIGSEGFGFALKPDGTYQDIPQLGIVEISDYVSIGANTTIDRATLGQTQIAQGVKLDNLIQIGHNVQIGKNTVISAQTGISGSTKVGEGCLIGGQVGLANSLQIANHTRIGAQSGIGSNIKTPGQTLQGSPAIEQKQFVRASIIFKQLPAIQKQLKALEHLGENQQQLKELAQQVQELEEKVLNLPPFS